MQILHIFSLTPERAGGNVARMRQVAHHVIEKCGGPRVVAEMAGVDITVVYRWRFPPERNGTGGIIPARHHQTILDAARARGIDLKPSDFFDIEDA